MSTKLMFDHEKLDVYQLELQFVKWVTPLISDVKLSSASMVREVCDHLDRASLSILFNTAEGNGRISIVPVLVLVLLLVPRILAG